MLRQPREHAIATDLTKEILHLQTQIIQENSLLRPDVIPFAGKEVEPALWLPKGTERRLACLGSHQV
jgi:hypothetical protein